MIQIMYYSQYYIDFLIIIYMYILYAISFIWLYFVIFCLFLNQNGRLESINISIVMHLIKV